MEENKFKCNECNKYYKSYQSLWNHKKKFHSIITQNNTIKPQHNSIQTQNNSFASYTPINKLTCKYCSKIYSRIDNLNRHKKTCKLKEEIYNQNEEIIKQQNEIIKQNNEIIKQNEELINKTSIGLITTNNNTTNNNNNSNNTNNGTINNNNINIFQLGLETIVENLPKDEAVELLRLKGYGPLLRALMITHFLKDHPEGHNFFINDMNDKYATIYDTKTGKTINEPIEEACDTTIQNRLVDLEELKDKHKEELNETQLNNIDYIVDNDYPPHITDKLKKMACKNKDMVKKTIEKVIK